MIQRERWWGSLGANSSNCCVEIYQVNISVISKFDSAMIVENMILMITVPHMSSIEVD